MGKDRRTDNMCENNDHYRPWFWGGRVDQKHILIMDFVILLQTWIKSFHALIIPRHCYVRKPCKSIDVYSNEKILLCVYIEWVRLSRVIPLLCHGWLDFQAGSLQDNQFICLLKKNLSKIHQLCTSKGTMPMITISILRTQLSLKDTNEHNMCTK